MADVEDLDNLEDAEDLDNCLGNENDELHEQIEHIEPKVGMEFNGIDELFEFYKNYAKCIGFPVRKRASRKNVEGNLRSVTFSCSRGGKHGNTSQNPLKPQRSCRIGCTAYLTARLNPYGRWEISVLALDHNHKMSPSEIRFFRCNRRIGAHVRHQINLNDQAGIRRRKERAMVKATKKLIHLFYCEESEELARKVAAESNAINLQSISWRSFADGFPNLFINNAHDIRGKHVAFLASFSSPAVIFEQISVIFALPKLFIASFTLVLPFFPTGTFERIEEEGDVATAFTMARILSMVPKSRGGPTSLVIYDIHALQERFYFGDDVLPCFETGIPLLLQRLRQLPDANNITIAFPDDGAWKRFHKQLEHFPMIVCAKVREGDKRIVRIKEGNPEGQHVVIVDDLVQSGGTLIECQKVLAVHGASKVSAYVTHGVFPKRSWERFTNTNDGVESPFAYFWITDSCPLTVKAIANRAPFEVLSLAGSIADALQI